jgi:hypothetical protein
MFKIKTLEHTLAIMMRINLGKSEIEKKNDEMRYWRGASWRRSHNGWESCTWALVKTLFI